MDEDKALVKAGTGAVVTARSFQDWGPGQLLYVDRRGRALTPAGRLRASALAVARPVTWTGVAAGALWWLGGPLPAAIYSGIMLTWIAASVIGHGRRLRVSRRAAVLIADGRMEEAHAALTELLPRVRPGSVRVEVLRQLAAVEICLGRPAAGLVHLDELLALASRGRRDMNAHLAEALRVEALALMSRLDEARRARAALPTTAESELIASMRQSAILCVAFHADAPGELPDDAVLHQWARDTLALSQFGPSLVILSWAFHQRGDDDMARHLLSEAPPRMPRWPLERVDPKLHAWMVERQKTWGLEVE